MGTASSSLCAKKIVNWKYSRNTLRLYSPHRLTIFYDLGIVNIDHDRITRKYWKTTYYPSYTSVNYYFNDKKDVYSIIGRFSEGYCERCGNIKNCYKNDDSIPFNTPTN